MGSAKPGDLDVGVAGIDADSAFGVTFKHDDTLEDAQEANPNPNLNPNPNQRRISGAQREARANFVTNPNPNPNPSHSR